MEKRRKKRYSKKVTAFFRYKESEHIGTVANISEQGLLLQANRIYAPGTALIIRLSLETQKEVYCTGVVRWAKRVPPALIRVAPHGMGILLTDIPHGYHQWMASIAHPQTRHRPPLTEKTLAQG